MNEEQWKLNKRLGHARLRLISKQNRLNLLKGLPNLIYQLETFCEACKILCLIKEHCLYLKTIRTVAH